VVRCFSNDDVAHISGRIDPIADITIINTELLLADLETIEKALTKANKSSKSGDKQARAEQQLLTELKTHLDSEKPARDFTVSKEQHPILQMLHLLTAKPILYIANVDERSISDNTSLREVENYAQQESSVVIPLCAAIEAEIAELDEPDKLDFLKDMGLKEPGLSRVIREGHKLLGLHTYFTAGPKEVRAWTIPAGATAPQAAGVIHTDFEKGFIRAEVTAYEDFIAFHGEQGAKEAGKLRLEGKDYVVHDGDVMHFRFSPT